MRFSDRLVRCEACGVEFVYTVREQRQRSEKGLPTDPPSFCTGCRAADVRLAEAAAPEDEAPEAVEAPESPPQAEAPATATAETAAPVAQTGKPTKEQKPKEQRSGRKRRGKGGQRRGKGGGKGRRPQKQAPRQTELRIRHVGTVKWFDEARGYGFIAQDDGEELFVHTSGVLGPSGQALEQGQQVEYEIEHTKRGLQAVDVIQLP